MRAQRIPVPAVLLLDEPTSGLDAEEQSAVGDLLVEVSHTRPITILLVEHHMEVVRRVASKVVGIQSGSMLAMGTPSEVLDSEEVLAAFTGRIEPEAPGSPDGKLDS